MQQSSIIPGNMMYYAHIDRFEWKDYAEDHRNFVVSYLNKFGGPLVELGCGTGNVLEQALLAGYKAHGIDFSFDMLEAAKKRLFPTYEDMLTLEQGDFRYAKWPKGGVVTCMLNTFAMLPDRQARILTFKNVAQHIQTGGCAVFAVINPIFESFQRKQTYETDAGPVTIKLSHSVQRSIMSDTINIEFILAGKVVETHTIPMCLISVQQFTEEAKEADLVIDATFGDFQRNAFNSENSTWHIHELKYASVNL